MYIFELKIKSTQTFIILEEIEEFIIINNESISDCDDDEYVTANIIEENIEEYYHWALCVEQVDENKYIKAITRS